LGSSDEDDSHSTELYSDSVDFEGFNVAPGLVEETIDDTLRSKDEQEKNAEQKLNHRQHPFDKACPYGYFICDNGECIAPRWRCDGHADCDDYSDELNCTSIDMPQHVSSVEVQTTNFTQRLSPNITAAHLASLPLQVYGLDFNSTVEPLMIFSTGQSIRGFWMRSRVYFDIVTKKQSQASSETTSQPSISEAFTLFFGMLGLDPTRSPLVSSAIGASDPVAMSRPDDPSNKPENTIVGLDMNPGNKEVFWVELGKDPGVYSAVIEDEQFEARHRRQFHGHKKIVQFGLLSPEDIALETVGRNAYITDAGLPAVVVCSYVHVHCRILVQTKIHKPRAIIADSSSGWVIYTDWGDRPGIFLVSMDGKRRETLIETDVVWPNGLAQDYLTNSLFWADARLNKIERIDLSTRKRTVLRKEIESNPFSVSVFENRIYWSDWSGNDIKTCDKNTGNNTHSVINAEDIYGIHIYHPDEQRNNDISNPCWSKHCSHLCLLAPPSSSTFGQKRPSSIGATCACPDSMALSIYDKATCYEVHLSFLLVNVKNYIAQVFPERIGLRALEEIVYSKDHVIQDIASDWLHYKLFFFDSSRKQIFSADFSGRQATFEKFAAIGTKSIRSMVYDFLSDNLFWLDPEAGTLTLCSVRSGKFQQVLRHNLDEPTSMVLDTKNRVFYIGLIGSRPRIIRTDIMGSESSEVVLFEKDSVWEPVALYLDEQEQRLYWADSHYETIESVELDVKSRSSGIKRGTKLKHRSRMGTVVSFAIYHNYLMWIVEGSNYLYRAKKDERHSRPVAFKLPQPLAGGGGGAQRMNADHKRLITVNPMTETLSSPCLKRGCSHACIMDRDRMARCICPDGFHLQAANKSNCVDASKPDPSTLEEHQLMVGNGLLLTSHADKLAVSAKQIDEMTHILPQNSSSSSFGAGASQASVSNYKISETPHVDSSMLLSRPDSHLEEPVFEHQKQRTTVVNKEHHQAEGASSNSHLASPTAAQSTAAQVENPVRGNKVVWLITFLLVVAAAALVTVVSLMIMNKQTRWPSQLTVSFSSSMARSGDGSTLLLAAENE